eukprot:6068389-Lingulodinium_polyedra.AAC.1
MHQDRLQLHGSGARPAHVLYVLPPRLPMACADANVACVLSCTVSVWLGTNTVGVPGVASTAGAAPCPPGPAP